MFPMRQDGAEPPAPPATARAGARPGPIGLAPLGTGPRPPARGALRLPLSPLTPRPGGGGGGAIQKTKS